jgi:hypothetical protein
MFQYNIMAMMVIKIITPRTGRTITKAKFGDGDVADGTEHFNCNARRL